MERGSDWPGHVAALDDVVAFSQDDAGLVQRTQEKLASLRSTQRTVRLAVLACNDASGAPTSGRRTRVARALLAAVSETSFGRLVLTASAYAPASLRAELLTRAGELPRALGQSSATISLQFTAPRAPTLPRVRPATTSQPSLR
jgi:hypothetical protein